VKKTQEQRELKEFHFQLLGDGRVIDAAPVMAENEEKAFREARRQCRRLSLPGWSLRCTDTGTAQPAALFFEEILKKDGGLTGERRKVFA
jgi:hypothetical protein